MSLHIVEQPDPSDISATNGLQIILSSLGKISTDNVSINNIKESINKIATIVLHSQEHREEIPSLVQNIQSQISTRISTVTPKLEIITKFFNDWKSQHPELDDHELEDFLERKTEYIEGVLDKSEHFIKTMEDFNRILEALVTTDHDLKYLEEEDDQPIYLKSVK